MNLVWDEALPLIKVLFFKVMKNDHATHRHLFATEVTYPTIFQLRVSLPSTAIPAMVTAFQ